MQFSSSQPDFAAGGWEAVLVTGQSEDKVSFSQPIKPEHMLLGSQLLGTPGASQVGDILSPIISYSEVLCDWCRSLHLSPDIVAKTSEKTDALLHHREC